MQIRLLVTTTIIAMAGLVFNKASNHLSSFSVESKSGQILSVQATSSAQSNPQPSPSPTPSPSPSPVYYGFCLNVPVLMYHHIQPASIAKEKGQTALSVDSAVFNSQMNYLANHGYQTISADQFAQTLISHQKLGKVVVLTFDDGYADFYTYAYPIIQKYHLVANLMIPTGLLQNGDYLSWSQLKEMVGSGQVFAYNHTWSHRNLGSASQDVISEEVLTAQSQLETNLGKAANIFAYPYGSENNTVINFLRQNGFIAAFSTIGGTTQCDSFIMTLHRTRIGNAPLSSYGI